MKVEGSYVFSAPRETVFPMLRDRDVLVKILPGCEKLDPAGDDSFRGVISIKVGPVQGKFDGDVVFSDVEQPERGKIVVKGKGAPGFVSGTGEFWLENDGDGSILHYEGDAEIGGRLAAVGQRLLDTSARAVIQSGLDGLNEHILGTQTNDVPSEDQGSPPEQRSQADFAAGVARHMARDVLDDPARRAQIRKFGSGFAVFLVLYVLYRMLRSSGGST